jgi:hypothetical protein
MFSRKQCDCAYRLERLEEKVKQLDASKQDSELCMGVKEAYSGWTLHHFSDYRRFYTYATVRQILDALLAHCKVAVQVTPEQPEKVELVKVDAKK